MALRGMDKQNKDGLWVKYYTIAGVPYVSYAYVTWQNMLKRCKPLGEYQGRRPTYVDCNLHKDFEDFQIFANWFVCQIGYGIPKYQLDKDLLSKGGKIYSPECCVLIPSELNIFLASGNSKSDLPQGVSVRTDSGKYVAQIMCNGLNVKLGEFNNPEFAYDVYKDAKELQVRDWVKRLKQEFVVDPRVIECLENWGLE